MASLHPSSPLPRPPGSPRSSATAKAFAVLVALISAAYLLNPGFGVFELLPDNLPVVGNLDEAFFAYALLASLAALGLDLPFLRRMRSAA